MFLTRRPPWATARMWIPNCAPGAPCARTSARRCSRWRATWPWRGTPTTRHWASRPRRRKPPITALSRPLSSTETGSHRQSGWKPVPMTGTGDARFGWLSVSTLRPVVGGRWPRTPRQALGGDPEVVVVRPLLVAERPVRFPQHRLASRPLARPPEVVFAQVVAHLGPPASDPTEGGLQPGRRLVQQLAGLVEPTAVQQDPASPRCTTLNSGCVLSPRPGRKWLAPRGWPPSAAYFPRRSRLAARLCRAVATST